MAKKKETKSGLFTQVVENAKGKPYFGVYHKEAQSGITEPIEKDGVTTHFELFEELSGVPSDVYVYTKELTNNKKFELLVINLLQKDGTIESVQVGFESGYAASFIQRMENINKDKEVTLKIFSILDEVKTKEKGKDIFNKFLIPYQLAPNPAKDGAIELMKVENRYKAEFSADDTNKENNLNPNKLPQFDTFKVKENGKNVTKYNTDNFKEALRDIVKHCNASYKKAHEAEKATEPASDEAESFKDDSNY